MNISWFLKLDPVTDMNNTFLKQNFLHLDDPASQEHTGRNFAEENKALDRRELNFTLTQLYKHVFQFQIQTPPGNLPGWLMTEKLAVLVQLFELTLTSGFLNIMELNPKIKQIPT